jgi:hypothetical protein
MRKTDRAFDNLNCSLVEKILLEMERKIVGDHSSDCTTVLI